MSRVAKYHTSVALDDYRVSFVMAAGNSRRTFTITIPATSEKAARDGAEQIAWGINEVSGHVWKMTAEVRVEAVGGETR